MAVSIIQVLTAVKNAINLDVVTAAEKQIDEKLSDVNYLTSQRLGDEVGGIFYLIDLDLKMTLLETEELKNRYITAGYPAVCIRTKNVYTIVAIYTQLGTAVQRDNLLARQGAFLTQPGVMNPSQQVTADEFIRQLNTDQDNNMNAAILALNEAHQEKMKATYAQYNVQATYDLSCIDLKNTP